MEADPFDEAVIKACNPALGHFLKLDDLLIQAEQARSMPSFEAKFRNLRLNQRISQEAGLVSRDVWSACDAEPLEAAFENSPVKVALDLSARNDLTALVYTAELEEELHVRAEFFAPKVGIAERSHRDRAPYEMWAQKGYITATPGASVDYDVVARRLAELHEKYAIKCIFFDRWRIDVLEAALSRIGLELPLVPHGQGYKDMAPAVDTLEAELMNRRLRHGDNPVLNMCAYNVMVSTDPAGNRKLDKAKSNGRIDGIVALAMTMSQNPEEEEVGYWPDQGVVAL